VNTARFVIPALLLGLALAQAAGAERPEEAAARQKRTTVTAIIPLDSPPTYFKDQKTGQASGFAVEVMNAAAERAGLGITYIYGREWSEMIDAVDKGRADVMPGMGYSEERARKLAFTRPIDTFAVVAFVRAGEDRFTDLREGLVVGSVKGSVAFERFRKMKGLKIITYDGFSQGLFALLSGEIDAFCCPEPTLWQLARSAGVEDRIKTTGRPLAEIRRSLAVRKGNDALLGMLDTSLEGYVGSDEYRRTYVKWYGKPEPFWTAKRTAQFGGLLLVSAMVLTALGRYLWLKRMKDALGRMVRDRTAALEQEVLIRKQTEQESRTILRTALDGFVIVDMQGRFQEANEAFCRMLGSEREELLTMRITDIEAREQPDETAARIRAIRATGGDRFQSQLRRRDGTVIDVEVSVTYSEQPPDRMFAFVRDITERKQTDDALARSESQLRTIVENEPECVKLLARDGSLIMMNAAGLAMIEADSLDQVRGKYMSSLVCAPYREAFERVTEEVFRGNAGRLEFEAEGLKGGRLWLDTHAVPLRDRDGAVTALLGITRNVTERKEAEEAVRKLNAGLEQLVRERTEALEQKGRDLQESQAALVNIVEDLNQKTEELEAANSKLRELDRLKSVFIASMSHELRTPLNSIIGFSSITLNEWTGPVNEEQRENLASILRSGKHLLSLINDVIDVSKLEAGVIETHAEDFDVAEVLTEAATFLAKEAKNKGIALRPEPVSLTVRTDRRRLLQCLLNLLSNAVKFTEQGSVRLVCTAAGNAVTVEVIDTGIGVSAEDKEKLFKPFRQVDTGINRQYEGTGLGLSICKRLVELLGGSIWMES